VVSILSLCSPCVIRFWRKQEEGARRAAGPGPGPGRARTRDTPLAATPPPHTPPAPLAPRPQGGAGGLPPAASVALPRRSLLVFAGDAYESCLHGIEAAAAEALDCSVVNREQALAAAAAASAGGRGAGDDEAAAAELEPGVVGDGGDGAAAGNGCGCCAAEGARPAGTAAAAAGSCSCGADPGGGCVLPRTGERLSLTIRRVLKVHKGLRLPGVAAQ
jgi:hypothetical protein